MKLDTLENRTETLLEVISDYADDDDTILEIGQGTGRNVKALLKEGYLAEGIDKKDGTAIEDVEPKEYDIVFTMSTLFLIPPENDWVFEKIAKMAKKYIITFEGEATSPERNVYGRNYDEVFSRYGFTQVEASPIFNKYGMMRVMKRCQPTKQ